MKFLVVILALALIGCGGPSPLPGANQWEVVAAYGKPDYAYHVDGEFCMEWHEDGTWIRRSYFKMKNQSSEETGTIRYAMVLSETRLNWGHEFFRPVGESR